MSRTEGPGGQTDAAALASGVVAVVVAMFVEEGAFEPLGAIVVVSLALVILAYVGSSERKAFQSLAFAAVFGLLALPLVGVFMEDIKFFHGEPVKPGNSRVSTDWLVATWAAGTALVWGLDRLLQRQPLVYWLSCLKHCLLRGWRRVREIVD